MKSKLIKCPKCKQLIEWNKIHLCKGKKSYFKVRHNKKKNLKYFEETEGIF